MSRIISRKESSSLGSGSGSFDTVARMIAKVADALEYAQQGGSSMGNAGNEPRSVRGAWRSDRTTAAVVIMKLREAKVEEVW
jgi:hypothetical protein